MSHKHTYKNATGFHGRDRLAPNGEAAVLMVVLCLLGCVQLGATLYFAM